MTFLARAGRAGGDDSAANNCGSDRPPSAARAPAWRVSRRVNPSQQRRGLPSRRSMGPPGTEDGGIGEVYLTAREVPMEIGGPPAGSPVAERRDSGGRAGGRMILEGLVTTTGPDGAMHLAPMGPRVEPDWTGFLLRPFPTAQTDRNLKTP